MRTAPRFGKMGFSALVTVVGVLLGVSPPAVAATFALTGETTSILEAYDDSASGEGAMPFYQYLRLNFAEGGEGGQKFVLYGRLSGDLRDQVDAESRLYYAWYEKKGLFPGTDVRVGRQWVNTVAGSPVIDGLLVRTSLMGVSLSGFGGGHVTFDDERDDAWTWGLQAARGWGSLDASLSYMQKWVKSDLAREYAGGEVSLALPMSGSAYGEFQYDLVSGVLGYWLAGARMAPTDRLTLRGEYLGSTPVFDATDIYSVFAVDDYREASVKADYLLDREWSLFGGYTREFYKEGKDSNVAEAGIELRRPRALHGYLSAVYRTGEEDLKGFKASVGAPVFYGINLDGGVEYNVYTRIADESDGSDTSAKRFWVEGKREMGKAMTLAGKFERIESAVYRYYNRGRLSLAYRF